MGFLMNPPRLAPRPDFEKIQALCKHIVMALKHFVCPPKHHTRMDGPCYGPGNAALIKITTAFVLISEPRKFPVYKNIATKATIKIANKRLERGKNYHLSFSNINRACFCMLNKNIANQLKVSNTPNMMGWNSLMCICSILEQLKTLFGKPDTMLLFHNDALFRSSFPSTKAPGILFY